MSNSLQIVKLASAPLFVCHLHFEKVGLGCGKCPISAACPAGLESVGFEALQDFRTRANKAGADWLESQPEEVKAAADSFSI